MFDPWIRKIPWRRQWQPTPVSLPENFHGQRSLVGYRQRGCKESDTTEHSTKGREGKEREKQKTKQTKKGANWFCSLPDMTLISWTLFTVQRINLIPHLRPPFVQGQRLNVWMSNHNPYTPELQNFVFIWALWWDNGAVFYSFLTLKNRSVKPQDQQLVRPRFQSTFTSWVTLTRSYFTPISPTLNRGNDTNWLPRWC